VRPNRILLLAAVLVVPATSASAVPPVPAVTTSFVLQAAQGTQLVHLTALREQTGDVLVVRTTPCLAGACGMATQERVPLPPDALKLDADTAELAVNVSGRALSASWVASAGSAQIGSSRIQSDGASGSTSAEGFAGRSAEVTLSLDGAGCQVDGGIGSAFSQRVGPEPEPDSVALVTGPPVCEATAGTPG
jgi:hypothetical protein